MALPIGNKTPEKIEKGHADSAPANPKLGFKAIITSIVTLPITYFVVLGIKNKVFVKLFAHFLN